MKGTFHKKLIFKKVTIAHYLYGKSATPNSDSDPIRSSAFHEPTEVPTDFPALDHTDQSQDTTLISGNQQSCM